jgi:ParB family chromosome partitioning protein
MTIGVRVEEMREMPISELSIGQSQARTRQVSKNLGDLVASIRATGLLQPIVVCPPEKEGGKYEVLTGQRRFLAHKELGLDTIMACVLSRRVTETEAKVISLTENSVRENMNRADLIDACGYLYNKYKSVSEVVSQTGLTANMVKKYVTVDRLHPEVKKAVNEDQITMDAAIRATEACDPGGMDEPDVKEILEYALAMSRISRPQQDQVAIAKRSNPKSGVQEILDIAKENRQSQVVTTLSGRVHQSLQEFAKAEKTTQDMAAAALIEEGLDSAGYETK